MTPRRLLLISGEHPPMPGGVGDYTASLRTALVAQGVDSVVLASRGARGDGVHTVRGWRSGTFRRVSSLIASEGVDLVHIQYQAGAYDMRFAVNTLPYAIRSRLGLPVVTTFHDLRPPYLFPKAGPLRNLVMLRMARAAAAVVVTNAGDERALARKRIASELIHIGPNLPPPDPDAGDVDRGTVAFFGFPSRSKGVVELIEALGMIDSRSRPRLALVGEQGLPSANNDILKAQEIDQRAASAGVRVERTGRLPAQEASNRLARAAVIALPFQGGASLRSGSLLAALQAGRPVVTTEPANAWRLGALAGMQQFALVIRDDPEDLRDAIVDALASPPAAGPLPPEFRWQAIAERHRALYASLPDGKAGNRRSRSR
ncbi:MAG TPA: glycosyltransferase [Thermomicrobiales bacterium]|nr:glycosyltransferase [Thermomicrobiales bacterium]